MTIGEYFKAKRMDLKMSLREAANVAGISHVHIKDIEDDRIKPSFEKITNLLRAYHADIQEFLVEINFFCVAKSTLDACNVEPALVGKLNSIPVISLVAAGNWKHIIDDFQPGDAEEWVSSEIHGENIFAVRVLGDSMEPEFTEGDIIIVDPHANVTSGNFVIVKNEDGEATLKQLKKYDNTKVLHPLNAKYEDIVLSEKHQYVIVGKVVEKKKRY